MSADELAGGDLKFELLAEVYTSFFLCLSTAVRDKDIGTNRSQ
jgi:hypothetical protein